MKVILLQIGRRFLELKSTLQINATNLRVKAAGGSVVSGPCGLLKHSSVAAGLSDVWTWICSVVPSLAAWGALMGLGTLVRLFTWCFYGGKRLQRRPFISPRASRPQTSWKRRVVANWQSKAHEPGTNRTTLKLRSCINWDICRVKAACEARCKNA